jgi:hypothetical protein
MSLQVAPVKVPEPATDPELSSILQGGSLQLVCRDGIVQVRPQEKRHHKRRLTFDSMGAPLACMLQSALMQACLTTLQAYKEVLSIASPFFRDLLQATNTASIPVSSLHLCYAARVHVHAVIAVGLDDMLTGAAVTAATCRWRTAPPSSGS